MAASQSDDLDCHTVADEKGRLRGERHRKGRWSLTLLHDKPVPLSELAPFWVISP